MRPTDLKFRPPDERTSDFNTERFLTRQGSQVDMLAKTSAKGTNFSQSHRFGLMGFYDSGTG